MKEEKIKHQTQLCGKRIGIYTGSGTSHSWLWFVEIMERAGFDNLIFMTEDDIRKDACLKNIDILLLSGGDTFSIAEGIGDEGAKNIERFIEEGGVYFGSCAGAYLPLRSSKYPLNLLNLAGVKISNLTRLIPQQLSHSEKFCTPYGCSYVFQPVREEIKIKIVNNYSSAGHSEIKAPLYGGPCMEPSEDVAQIAFYKGFTDKTLFLVDEELAKETVLGRMAVCSKAMGKGRLYLSGPHLEHPHYPEANQLLMEMLSDGLKEKQVFFYDHGEIEVGDKISHDLFRELKREISGARIIALALERESITWLIGKKVYEPEKFRVFIDALWARLDVLEENSQAGISSETMHCLTLSASEIREKLMKLKNEMNASSDTEEIVGEIINALRNLSSTFMNVYFDVKRRKNRQEEKSNVHVL